MLTVAGRQAVLVELNLAEGAGVTAAANAVLTLFERVFPAGPDAPPAPERVSSFQRCWLTSEEIKALLAADATGTGEAGDAQPRAIFRIWPDYVLTPHLDRSVRTVNADAASRVYGASGKGVVWAVIDSGIDKNHPHFAGATLSDPGVAELHRDFTDLVRGSSSAPPAGSEPAPPPSPEGALTDPVGHGTHVAAIIAGQTQANRRPVIATSVPTSEDLPQWVARELPTGAVLSGVAPEALLVSLKVLAPGDGENAITTSSAVIKALAWIREVNTDGRQLRIHGANLSLGCPWFPDDYAAGQSPLCREIDLLVGTGVVVVVSAGNQGASGTVTGQSSDVAGALSTITDPGNAERAITVGSSHKEAPHVYGVSYTSSKGPTLDGRRKPDLVAPGEHIASAATGALGAVPPLQAVAQDQTTAPYREESGTSQAAPHVSGAIAAFLSVRTEFIGRPQEVKEMFCAHASDLHRHEFYQGAGMVDLMKVFSNL
ncbi:MAG: S8 family peptidase [Mycobacteriales bacterium]